MTGKYVLPIVVVKAKKKPFKQINYSSKELVDLVLNIAKDCKDEDEALEESLFRSTTHVMQQSIQQGANPNYTAEAVLNHFKGTEYELPADVFFHYLKYAGALMVSNATREICDGINKRARGRIGGVSANKKHIEDKKSHRKAFKLLREKGVAGSKQKLSDDILKDADYEVTPRVAYRWLDGMK